MTGMVPIMWTVWGALVLLMLLLKIYNDRLTRDEDDQLVLDEAFDHVKNQQAAIMAKVNRFAPVRRVVLVLVAAMTLFVIGYYLLDFHQPVQVRNTLFSGVQYARPGEKCSTERSPPGLSLFRLIRPVNAVNWVSHPCVFFQRKCGKQ